MERNRRIAKAYARSPVINVNGGSIGFDGDSIGLEGFDNPFRDQQAVDTHRRIGSQGFLVAADEDGNILLDPCRCRSRLLLTNASSHLRIRENSLVKENGRMTHSRRPRIPPIMTSFKGSSLSSTKALEEQKSGVNLSCGRTHKIFDMKKFLKGMNNQLIHLGSRERIDEDLLLESQCISIISFDADHNHYPHEFRNHPNSSIYTTSQEIEEQLMETPVWIMIINVIALEMIHRNFNHQSKWKM